MANNLQKLIYNLSAVSPLCFTFAILWYCLLYTSHTPPTASETELPCGSALLALRLVAWKRQSCFPEK